MLRIMARSIWGGGERESIQIHLAAYIRPVLDFVVVCYFMEFTSSIPDSPDSILALQMIP